jgi:hypothetical protein
MPTRGVPLRVWPNVSRLFCQLSCTLHLAIRMRRHTHESRLSVCDLFKGKQGRIERQPVRIDVDMSRLKGLEVSLGPVWAANVAVFLPEQLSITASAAAGLRRQADRGHCRSAGEGVPTWQALQVDMRGRQVIP